jgi:hypothetical protein
MHGKGVYIYADGDRYDGDFQRGKPHGKGCYLYASGQKTEGEFRLGKLVHDE